MSELQHILKLCFIFSGALGKNPSVSGNWWFRFLWDHPDKWFYWPHAFLFVLDRLCNSFLVCEQHLCVYSAINLKLKNKIHPKEMSLTPVPLYCIEEDAHMPLNKGHFVLKQLHLKENSNNPSSNQIIWIQRQLLALDLHCRGTCLQGVVIFGFSFSSFFSWVTVTISDISFSRLLLLCCLAVPLFSALCSANPSLCHYCFLLMDHKT